MSSSTFSYVLISFLLLTTSKSNEAARRHRSSLARPKTIRWHIAGDALILTWMYSKRADLPVGFYVKLQESLPRGGLGPPQFVHVDTPRLLSTDVRGLKPHTRYYVKIIAFSPSRSKSSRAIEISTMRLDFLKVNNFKASSITDTGAVFTWDHKSATSIQDLSFKVLCNGKMTYHENGKQSEEEVKFEHTCPGSSFPHERHKVTSLLPNTLYTCSIITIANTRQSDPHSTIQFKTLPGKPLAPSPPRVVMNSQDSERHNFDVHLSGSSDKYGPISHYVVFAVPVSQSQHAAPSEPYIPLVPVNKLMTKAVSAHLATTVSDRLPFIVGRYEAHRLPPKLVFDGSLDSLDFKPDTHYGFVVAAFGETKDESELKYSFSGVSNPPVYIGPDMNKEWIDERRPAAKRFMSIVITTMVTFIIVLSLVVIVVVGLAYMKKKQYGSITFDEENDIETYTTRAAKRKRKLRSTLGLQQYHKKAYHKLDTSGSGEFLLSGGTERRLDQVRKETEPDEPEQRPLFSVATPPDSPRHPARPTSPLVQSKKEQHHSPDGTSPVFPWQQTTPTNYTRSHPKDYTSTSVAMAINPNERLGFGRPLPKRDPYVPPKPPLQSHYTMTHTPGTPHPVMKPPEAPPPPGAIRLGVKEGYVMPKEGMPRRSLVREMQYVEQRLRQECQLKEKELLEQEREREEEERERKKERKQERERKREMEERERKREMEERERKREMEERERKREMEERERMQEMEEREMKRVVEERERMQEKQEREMKREMGERERKEEEKEGRTHSVQRAASLPNNWIPHLKGGVIVVSNSAYCRRGSDLLSDDEYMDAITCDHHVTRKS